MIIINLLRERVTYIRYIFRIKRDKGLLSQLNSLQILDKEETVRLIIDTRCSVSRFGDGEFYVMNGESNGFQIPNPILAERLKEVLVSTAENLLICIPETLKDWSKCRFSSKLFAAGFCLDSFNKKVAPFLNYKKVYGDSLFTRFYMMYAQKNDCRQYVNLLKQVWHDKDILIVEGKKSRLGVGNDLFSNTRSIKRILCPNRNAFNYYDEILTQTKANCENRLILLALGMTATVLAYDLSKSGYQAIDLGHVDIEYEWMLMNAVEKCSIPGKMMSEVTNGTNPKEIELDKSYSSEIICIIR